MSSTAFYRELALDLESRREWERAAQAWQSAINNYPWPGGALAANDIAQMADRRDYCVRAANAAKQKT